jgi:hypothetical protein
MSDEREIKMMARGIQKQLERMDKKMTAYMMAKIELEVCVTQVEKLKVIREVMGKLDDYEF